MWKISRYIFLDIIRNRVILLYTIFQLLIGFLLFSLEENSSKALMSLLNIELIVIPLISMIFSTIQYYNSYEFMEMLLAQPVGRLQVLGSEFLATAGSLVVAFLIGQGFPIALYYANGLGLNYLFVGIGLSLSCAAIAFLAAVLSRDKARGIGVVLLI